MPNDTLCSHYDEAAECPLCTGPGAITPDDIDALSRWVVPSSFEKALDMRLKRFDESQVGGAFDGFSVVSDADGGL